MDDELQELLKLVVGKADATRVSQVMPNFMKLSGRENNLLNMLSERGINPKIGLTRSRNMGSYHSGNGVKRDSIHLNHQRFDFDYLNKMVGRDRSAPHDSAFVLAHELGHGIQGFGDGYFKQRWPENEKQMLGYAKTAEDSTSVKELFYGVSGHQKQADMIGISLLDMLDGKRDTTNRLQDIVYQFTRDRLEQ